MKFAYLYLVLSLVFTGLFSEAQAIAAPGAGTAAISKVEGDGIAKVRRKSGIETVAGEKQELFEGDRITTDSRSVVELMLADGSLVRIGLNSEYRLESVEKKNGIFSWVFGLAKGSIRAMVEKNPKKDMVKFRVNTPVGTMGVRGTELVLDHNDKRKRTTLYTIEGRVEFGGKGCYLNRKCIEVKAGETASVGENPSEQPVATPAAAASVLLMNSGKNNKDAAMEAATEEERLARAALFTDLKKAENLKSSTGSIEAAQMGSVDKILKEASDAMAAAQDQLLGRSVAERENLNQSIANGTYEDKLKLAEKFDDIRDGSNGKGKSREKENLNASNVNKKLKLADAILGSKKMKSAIAKQTAMDNDLINAKLKAAQDNLNEARGKIGLSDITIVSDTKTDTKTGTSTSTDTDVKNSNETEEVKNAVEKLDKKLVDAVLKESTVVLASESYSYEDKDCFMFFCSTKTKTKSESTETETTKVERKSGICYETKKNCKRSMIPCDLSKGKSCKPTFTNYECTENKIQISCPVDSPSNSGKGSGINSGYSGGDR